MVRLWLRKAPARRRLYLLSHVSSSFTPAMNADRRRAPITLHGTVTPRMTVLASVSLATFLVTGLAATQFRSQPVTSSNRLARDEALRQSVNQLEDQNRALKSRVQALQAEVKAGADQRAPPPSAVQQVKALLDEPKATPRLTPPPRPGLTPRPAHGGGPH